MAVEMRGKGIEELCKWLEEKGIPFDMAEIFRDNQVDGETFLELLESDVKDMIKPLGLVKKIIRLQRSVVTDSIESQSFDPHPMDTVITPSSLSPGAPTTSSDDSFSLSSSSTHVAVRKSGVPLDFIIPTCWRPSIMECIKKKSLNAEVRNEIVRDLVTNMYGYIEKPGAEFSTSAAQKLVLKYPFMRDHSIKDGSANSHSGGYGSWERKLIDRINNVEKKRKRHHQKEDGSEDETPRKRGRPKKPKNLEYYLVDVPDEYDKALYDRHVQALHKEMDNKKPSKDVVLHLMQQTYNGRRQFIYQAKAIGGPNGVLQQFPAFAMPIVLEQEAELVLKKKELLKNFTTEWKNKFVPAIIQYSKSLKKKEIVQVLKMFKDSGEYADEKLAFMLASILLIGGVKKDPEWMSYFYEQCPDSTDPEEAASAAPSRNSPRIIELAPSEHFFISIEQSIVCQVSSFTKALFLWFVVHYLFNLQYHKHAQGFATFLQEFLFGLPSTEKRSPTYLSTVTDIQSLIMD